MESVFELHPREVYVHQFADAYQLHNAASATYRRANRYALPGEEVKTPEEAAKAQQRKAILLIAAQLLVTERNRLLDEFATDWLRFRHLPIPERENESKSGVDLQRASGTDEAVQGEVRNNSVGAKPADSPSHTTSPQSTGGVSVQE